MIGAHEMAVLRAIGAGEWRKGWTAGSISAPAAESARRRLCAAHLIRMASAGPVLTERGRAFLNPTPAKPMTEYVPPAPLPTRPGAMRWATLPSVYGSEP